MNSIDPAAVSQNRRALFYAAGDLQAALEIALAAVPKHAGALETQLKIC